MAGLLLAAGSGSRYGLPKALADDGDGPWVLRSLAALASLPDTVVVLGAAAAQVAVLLPGDLPRIVNPAYPAGMGSSIRAGLAHLADTTAEAALVMLVDLPGVGREVVDRLAEAVTGPDALLRASYHGVPGHPVVLGRAHWAGVMATASGDHGARDYLAAHPPAFVECGDIGHGRDVDRPG